MEKPLIIIKLGGSIISLKDTSTPKARGLDISRIAKELRKILTKQACNIILIHGVGSFGHPLAKKHNLVDGIKTEEQKFGYCLMEERDLKLHYTINHLLIKNQIPAIGLSPRSFIKTSNKIFSGFGVEIIKGYLKLGLTPVLFGDGIYDDQQGCSILSGDITMTYLAQQLQAEKVIFLSDVDGVFDADPKKNPQARLIPEINDRNLNQVLEGLTNNNPNDVSGEMRGKVVEIKQRLGGIAVYIINGLKENTLTQVIEGHSIGTRLLFR